MKRAWLPLAVFVVLLGFLGVGLTLKPRELPSALMDKPLPDFRLPVLAASEQWVGPKDLRGQVWLLNVWASWCVACQAEHPALMAFSQAHKTPLLGLNYKDRPDEALRWLARHGNPYQRSLADRDGRVGIDLGVYGVPETFVIDRQGVIRFKHTGAVTPELLQNTILPLIGRLNG
jgi:cytochrome c biogenesis protein CcmG/thiol:disulfide interchange protein DsbE